MTERTVGGGEVFSGRVFGVTVEDVLLPDGRTARKEIVRHSGGVCVLALLEDGPEPLVPLVRQYRYGAAAETLEIPAGRLEAGEDPEECGRRELAEECGLLAESFVPLGTIYPTPAYCDEVIHIFLARGLSRTEACLDDDEFLSVEYVTLERLAELCRDGGINDAKTVVAAVRTENRVQRTDNR
ncbi:MAG: NUDIX hydrolase [Oscillospiraceae bacterium]|nr:NUDIX hydrolase [Oscillospiraceae bacterium]